MNTDVFMFFDKMPAAFPLYEAIADRLLDEYPGVKIKATQTHIAFANKYQFAYVSLPIRRRKGWPDVCVILTFGLGCQVVHPRIDVSTEPYPNRWTHHVIVQSVDDVDWQLMDWIREAYNFSLNK